MYKDNEVFLSRDIINLALGLAAYDEFLFFDSLIRTGDVWTEEEQEKMLFRYFCSLPLPKGVGKNQEDFHMIRALEKREDFYTNLTKIGDENGYKFVKLNY